MNTNTKQLMQILISFTILVVFLFLPNILTGCAVENHVTEKSKEPKTVNLVIETTTPLKVVVSSKDTTYTFENDTILYTTIVVEYEEILTITWGEGDKNTEIRLNYNNVQIILAGASGVAEISARQVYKGGKWVGYYLDKRPTKEEKIKEALKVYKQQTEEICKVLGIDLEDGR